MVTAGNEEPVYVFRGKETRFRGMESTKGRRMDIGDYLVDPEDHEVLMMLDIVERNVIRIVGSSTRNCYQCQSVII